MTRDEVPEDKILQNPVKGKQAKITLFTCVSWQNNQERLLVGGHLKSSLKYCHGCLSR